MKRWFVVVVAVAAAVGVAGCGSGDDQASTSSSTSSAKAGALKGDGSKVGDVVALSDLSKRTQEATKKAGSVKVKMASAGETLNGELAYAPKTAYKLSGTTEGDQLTLLFVDDVLYLGGDSFKAMNGGKPYIKVDPNGKDAFSQMMAPLLKTVQQASDPAALLAGVKEGTAKVVAIDGSGTTYESTLDSDQLKAAAEQQLGGSTTTSTSAPDAEKVTITQKIDKQNRPVTVELKGASSDATVTYSDWGTAVHLTAPPASQVGAFDASSLPTDLPTPTS